jgi:hypothetical protein
MADIRILSDDSIAALRRDHERLRYELLQTRTQLRAFMAAGSDRGLKPVCVFSLSAALSTSDATQGGTIIEQYGPGREHSDTTITVANPPKPGGAYLFYGASGAHGVAFWDPATEHWLIFQLYRECPEA